MRVSILCTDSAHPVNVWLERWMVDHREAAEIELRRDSRELSGGDILFLISCHQIIRQDTRDRYRHTLVIHASDLPRGRGWSPMIWAIVGGATEVVVSMLDAEDSLDSGAIWAQRTLRFDGTELYNEINAKLFDAELELMSWALNNIDSTTRMPQQGQPTYYRRRTAADSEIDPTRPLAESFDLLRVADPDRYPAFFQLRGQRYYLRIEKMV